MQNTKRTIRKIEKALCVVLLLTVAACNGKSQSTITKPLVPPKETLISWFRTNHDFCSYNLFSFYYDDDLANLPMAVYMAEHQQYGTVYYDIYSSIYLVFEENSIPIDSMTQQYLLYYLKKGVEVKDHSCVRTMSELYLTGEFVEKDTVKAKKYLMLIYSQDDVENLYWPHLKKNVKREQEIEALDL